MNNIPRQMLRQIVNKYGREICLDARRCENLLKDLCGSYLREINVLVTAIKERVTFDLLAANGSMPLELLLTRLEKRLEEQTALTADAARWATDSWALALNLATESEIQAREKLDELSTPPISKTETARPEGFAGNSKTTTVNRNNQAQPPPKPTNISPPKVAPPLIRQPIQTPNPAPPLVFPGTNKPSNPPPFPNQPTNQPVITSKGFGFLRGCLIVVFLLAAVSVALFLGVPYALEVMRQTQRERNNEPPRFPVR